MSTNDNRPPLAGAVYLQNMKVKAQDLKDQGMSISEIAENMGLPENYVRNFFPRAVRFHMHWVTAVQFARQQNDVTYEEWCDLYYDHANPTNEQIQKASGMAYAILLRNKIVPEEPMEIVLYGFDEAQADWPRRDDPRPELRPQIGE